MTDSPCCSSLALFLGLVLCAPDLGRMRFGTADVLLQNGTAFDDAVAAAGEGAEATKAMAAAAGRSNYVRQELLETVPDPGAQAVAIALAAVWRAISVKAAQG